MSLLEEFSAQSNAAKKPIDEDEARGEGFSFFVSALLLLLGLAFLVFGIMMFGRFGVIPGIFFIFISAFLGFSRTDSGLPIAFFIFAAIVLLLYKPFAIAIYAILFK